MNANKTLKYFVPCLTALAAAVGQAYAAEEGTKVTGEITPKLIYFDYQGGPSGGHPQYLQAYGGQRTWSGNRNSGLYADLDVDLMIGEFLIIERQGFGLYNHRGSIRGGAGGVGFKGYYSHFRSNSHGLDYLNRPGTANNPSDPAYLAANSGFIRQFNDDSPSRTDYHTERTRYGLAVKFRPDLLGKGTSLTLGFDGYRRDGNKFATWVAGNGDFGGGVDPNRVPQRWRGYEKTVDENMGRFSLNFTASPAGLFQLAYDGSYEKFNNKARTFLIGDFESFLENGVTVSPGSVEIPLHFIPDSTLASHAIRLSKNYGNTAVAMGYGMSRLKQDSFSNVQAEEGFKGKISTQNAFVVANHRFSPAVSVEGHVKYRDRDNDSSTGGPGLFLNRNVRDEWGVRIASLESLDYGVAATFSSLPVKSSLTAGWKRVDADRKLQYNNAEPDDNLGTWPTVSLYREETVSDEIYLKWVARPMQGVTLRISPSYVWADKTALVTEAEKAFNLKMALSYAMSSSMQVNAYYNFKDKENGNNRFVDTDKLDGASVVLGNAYRQKADDTFHAAGLSINLAPSEWTSLGASLDWAQNDFESYFFGTNRRRFEQVIVFDQRGISNYKVDTWSLSLTGDHQPTDELRLSASYTLSKSDGSARTTGLGGAGPAETLKDKIDNTLHSLAFGVAYDLQQNVTLRGMYAYDRYKDKAYSNLNGGQHTLMMGVSLGF